MVSCIGWLAQFSPGSREVIICKKDSTLRMSEPRYVILNYLRIVIILNIRLSHRVFYSITIIIIIVIIIIAIIIIICYHRHCILQWWKSLVRGGLRLSLLFANGSDGLVRDSDIRVAHEFPSAGQNSRSNRQERGLLPSDCLVSAAHVHSNDNGTGWNRRKQRNRNLFRWLRKPHCQIMVFAGTRLSFVTRRRLLFIQRWATIILPCIYHT